METLEGLLEAYETRLRADETIEQIWKRYPNPMGEERQLEVCRCLVEATQALLEKVSQTQPKEKEGLGLETHNIEEKGLDGHPMKTPGEEKYSHKSSQDPRRYPT